MNSGSKISKRMRDHYAMTFLDHGASPEGVDWRGLERTNIRYQKMLQLCEYAGADPDTVNWLDVGCGFGGFLDYCDNSGFTLSSYSGIDVVPEMIEFAQKRHPDCTFVCDDILTTKNRESHDLLICNGIFTQKLSTSDLEMTSYMFEVIAKMFEICTQGIAFNVMTSHVNYRSENLFYYDPADMINHCISNYSQKCLLDHTYGLFEYTTYLLKD